jgi:hypothetical protein
VVLRLRASAIAMRRSEQAAKRELEILQRTRREAIAAARKRRQPASSEPTPPPETATVRQPAGPARSCEHPGASTAAAETNAGVDRSPLQEILQAAAEVARLEAAQADGVQVDGADRHYQEDDAADAASDPLAGALQWATSGVPSDRAVSPSFPNAADPAFADAFGAACPGGVRSTAHG